jgi:hypothetical protein
MSAKPTPTPWDQKLFMLAVVVLIVISHTLEFNGG